MSRARLRPAAFASAGQPAPPRGFRQHPRVPQNLRRPKPHDAHGHRREGLSPLSLLVVCAVVHEEIFEARRGEHLLRHRPVFVGGTREYAGVDRGALRGGAEAEVFFRLLSVRFGAVHDDI